ncbi:hypothetical protein [Streptomyces aidingensis]|uniref:4-amino-4-deoxy-L-arabinose transferase n=1 Tax=Streptomyces aidingensis TaxID=910347 RepID=A0A1I1KC34_9ACTN|nr:hypothetical protein [Streptomyces aidingensis]SFC56248.1 hypothetical protein SAMN05421773_104100 [Streptomyces aidingensis]
MGRTDHTPARGRDSGFLALRLPATARGAARTTRAARWAAALSVAALLGWSAVSAELHGDLRYVLGALRAGDGAGFSAAETFTHRPLFYRWFIAALDGLAFGSTGTREIVIRLAGLALCAAAGVLLHAALIRRLPRGEALLTAAMTTLALALAPRLDFLQPEWTAVLLAVVAVSAVLLIDRPWPAAAVAAVPLGLAVMMKFSTAAIALMALLVVFGTDRARAVRAAVAGAGGAVLLFLLSLAVASHEWQWVRDMPRINRTGLEAEFLRPSYLFERITTHLGDRVFVSPVLALLPGVLLLVLARVPGRRERLHRAVPALLIGLAAVGAVTVQGQWFLYHSAVLPVFAAALWGLAVARWYREFRRPPAALLTVTLLLAAWGPVSHRLPERLHGPEVGWAAAAVALGAALLDLWSVRGGSRGRGTGMFRVPVSLIALAGVACLAVTVWPGSPHQKISRADLFTTNTGYWAATEAREAEGRLLRAEIGDPDAPVLYLAFGDVVYFTGLPGQCRYPVPTFLQRVRFIEEIRELPSHDENARCLTENPAPFAVLSRSWFRPGLVDEAVRDRIAELYDCPAREEAPDRHAVLCTRR